MPRDSQKETWMKSCFSWYSEISRAHQSRKRKAVVKLQISTNSRILGCKSCSKVPPSPCISLRPHLHCNCSCNSQRLCFILCCNQVRGQTISVVVLMQSASMKWQTATSLTQRKANGPLCTPRWNRAAIWSPDKLGFFSSLIQHCYREQNFSPLPLVLTHVNTLLVGGTSGSEAHCVSDWQLAKVGGWFSWQRVFCLVLPTSQQMRSKDMQ